MASMVIEQSRCTRKRTGCSAGLCVEPQRTNSLANPAMCGSDANGSRTNEPRPLTATLSSPRRTRGASVSSPDCADLAGANSLSRKGFSVNVGVILGRAQSAAAVAPTTGVVAAAADAVSALAAARFTAYAQMFQAISALAAAIHDRFVTTLAASAGSNRAPNPLT
ncbi:PE family protein [Mycobacterium marinum]|nr:PE family protein [Mycobacterium marinum]